MFSDLAFFELVLVKYFNEGTHVVFLDLDVQFPTRVGRIALEVIVVGFLFSLQMRLHF